MIVGLGNPGSEYERTRHNAGFLAIDLLADNLRATYWKDQRGAKVAVVRVGEGELVLVKPQTFMNLSGASVKKLAEHYGVPVSEIVIIHDDIDLPAGDVRVKSGGGHGGHNGLRSLHDKLGSDDYLRVRVGVGRPPGRMDAADWVLQPLKGAAWEEFEASLPTAAQAALSVLERGAEATMREYNGAVG
ncbi:MAG: aminoacyl-tRNA hydrolase [Coriobacteriia bacterium]|nr:aminoacyl-tRNA hydrolase [Coriobacteriia bacterium]